MLPSLAAALFARLVVNQVAAAKRELFATSLSALAGAVAPYEDRVTVAKNDAPSSAPAVD